MRGIKIHFTAIERKQLLARECQSIPKFTRNITKIKFASRTYMITVIIHARISQLKQKKIVFLITIAGAYSRRLALTLTENRIRRYFREVRKKRDKTSNLIPKIFSTMLRYSFFFFWSHLYVAVNKLRKEFKHRWDDNNTKILFQNWPLNS